MIFPNYRLHKHYEIEQRTSSPDKKYSIFKYFKYFICFIKRNINNEKLRKSSLKVKYD